MWGVWGGGIGYAFGLLFKEYPEPPQVGEACERVRLRIRVRIRVRVIGKFCTKR